MTATGQSCTKISMLYVEENEETRESVATVLAARYPGCKLQVEASGARALETCRRQRPDIVVADVNLPVGNGKVLAGEIRALLPGAIVIAANALCETDCLIRAVESGAGCYLLKPVDRDRLFAGIDAAIAAVGSGRQLRTQHEHIRQLSVAVEQSPSTVIITDADGTIEYANPKFTELTGFLASEAVGRNPRLLKSGSTPPEVYRELWRTIKAGQVWRGQLQNRKKNGEHYWESVSISPVLDASGRITHFVAVKEDISEWRRLTDELRRTHDELELRVATRTVLFKTLYETNQAIIRAKDLTALFSDICRIVVEYGGFRMAWIGMVDRESGTVRPVAASGAGTKYLDDLTVSVLDEPAGRGPTGRAIREGGPVVCNDFLHEPDTATWHEPAGGFGFRSAASFALSRFGEAIGAMTLYAGRAQHFDRHCINLCRQLAADISFALENIERERQRKEATSELERSRQELKEAQRVAGVGSWQYDLETGTISWSEEMYRIHGLERHSPVPTFAEHDRIFAPGSVGRLNSAVERAAATGEPYQVDLEILRPDGAQGWITARGEALYDRGGAVCMLRGTAIDITRSKVLEGELIEAKRLEAIGQLAGGLAHEVRNPLNAILSVSEALFKEPGVGDNRAYAPYIGHIREQVQRLAHLMNDLLELGKPIPAASLQPVPLYEVCAESIKLLELSGVSRGFHLDLRWGEDSDYPRVLADAIKLQQVLSNLLENALQHSAPGGVVSLALCTPAARGATEGVAVVQIRDAGPGIPKDQIGRVFEPFYSTRKGGTGLGLALVRHFIERMGGEVQIRNNEQGPGCIAEVRIPLAEGGDR